MTRTNTRGARGLVMTAAAAALLLLAGCGGSSDALSAKDDSRPAVGAPEASYSGVDAMEADAAGAADGSPAGGADSAEPTIERAVIATGDLRVTSRDPGQARQDALAVVRQLRGLVADEQTSSDDEGDLEDVHLVLRVPSASFEQALDELGEVGTVRHRSQSAEDVTTQVIDTRARVQAQTASVRSIRALLARARTIGEVMSIERELAERQAALDSLSSQQKYLADQTSLATITLSIERPATKDTEEDGGGFVDGLEDGWHALGDTARALGTAVGAALPFAAVLAVVGVPAWVLRRRRRGVSAR